MSVTLRGLRIFGGRDLGSWRCSSVGPSFEFVSEETKQLVCVQINEIVGHLELPNPDRKSIGEITRTRDTGIDEAAFCSTRRRIQIKNVHEIKNPGDPPQHESCGHLLNSAGEAVDRCVE